jgi:hypothetical protein
MERIRAMSHEPSEDEWREIARKASIEQDLEKLLELTQQLLEKYDKEKLRKKSNP